MDCTKAVGFTVFVVEFSKTQKPSSPDSDDGVAKWKTPKSSIGSKPKTEVKV